MRVKTKSKIILFLFPIVLFMMFIFPFFLPNKLLNNVTFGCIYLLICISLIGWSNYTGACIDSMSIDEKREEKLKDLL